MRYGRGRERYTGYCTIRNSILYYTFSVLISFFVSARCINPMTFREDMWVKCREEAMIQAEEILFGKGESDNVHADVESEYLGPLNERRNKTSVTTNDSTRRERTSPDIDSSEERHLREKREGVEGGRETHGRRRDGREEVREERVSNLSGVSIESEYSSISSEENSNDGSSLSSDETLRTTRHFLQ